MSSCSLTAAVWIRETLRLKLVWGDREGGLIQLAFRNSQRGLTNRSKGRNTGVMDQNQ